LRKNSHRRKKDTKERSKIKTLEAERGGSQEKAKLPREKKRRNRERRKMKKKGNRSRKRQIIESGKLKRKPLI